jgi:hypothetical protein
MSVVDQQKRLDEIERRLLNLGPAIAEYAADMAADIANRVINKGVAGDGKSFGGYSDKGVPAYLYFGRSVNASGEARVRAAAKKREMVSYRDFRVFNSRPVAFKNFSFTNDMWRGFGVLGVKTLARGVYEAELGGGTEDSEFRIAVNSAREKKSIIAPTVDELNAFYDSLYQHIFE